MLSVALLASRPQTVADCRNGTIRATEDNDHFGEGSRVHFWEAFFNARFLIFLMLPSPLHPPVQQPFHTTAWLQKDFW